MRSIPDPITAAAEANGEHAALVTSDRSITYADLDRLTTSAAARLAEEGGVPGSRIAFYLPNSADYVILLLAVLRLGGVACPLSTRLPAAALPGMLCRIGCRYLIAPTGETDWIEDRVNRIEPESLLKLAGRVSLPTNPEWRLDQPATVVFTSGSTGLSKAALHTWGNHYYSALGSNRNIRLQPGDRWLLSLPLYHVGGLGLLFRCLLAGAAVAVPEAGEPPHESIARYGVTHASMVATQLHRALRAGEEAALASLKALLLGGSAIPWPLIEEGHARRLPIHTSYGLTEMASQVTATSPGAGLDELQSSGTVLPHRQVRIADDGEVLVRGETLFAGYVDGEEITRPAGKDGWFHTRDVGAWDLAGNLAVLGRMDHMFISGGENIHPEEIERALCRLDGVAEAVVVPVADEEFGFRPVAFIRRSDGREPGHQLAALLGADLPRFKIPIAFLPLPEADTGLGIKIDRLSLKRVAAEKTGRL